MKEKIVSQGRCAQGRPQGTAPAPVDTSGSFSVSGGSVLHTWPFRHYFPPSQVVCLPHPTPTFASHSSSHRPAWSCCSAVHQESLEVISGEQGPLAVCTQLGKQTELGAGSMKGSPVPGQGRAGGGYRMTCRFGGCGHPCLRERPEPVSARVGGRAGTDKDTHRSRGHSYVQ